MLTRHRRAEAANMGKWNRLAMLAMAIPPSEHVQETTRDKIHKALHIIDPETLLWGMEQFICIV